MDLKILWRLDFELIPSTTDGTLKRKKLYEPKWLPFDESDIIFHSRDYVIKLFSNGTPVVIKQDQGYIVNSPELLEQYKKAGKDVRMITDLKPSTESVEKVGFLD